MSGTSADGIDAVVAEIAISPGSRRLCARILADYHRSFAPVLRHRILAACVAGSVSEVCELNFLLGRYFGQAALDVIARAGLKAEQITAIGSHGQTIHHLPNAPIPSTLQIGEPAVIAELTGITTVADFRTADVAAAGQGAPLVPFADWHLFTHAQHPRIIQNIGGIANLTYLPPRAKLTEVKAFDTGPGNMVIDAVVSALTKDRLSYDQNGAWASRGSVSSQLLNELMRHPFLKRAPSKTTGREEFGHAFAASVLNDARRLRLSEADIVATVTSFTAASIADAYGRFVLPQLDRRQIPKLQIILGGGGAKNTALRRMLAEEIAKRLAAASLDGVQAEKMLLRHEDFGIPSSAKEALAFAMMAHETLAGRPSNVPSATEAKRPVILGKVVRGKGKNSK